jgi:transglutaminase-like putative cysteine protease
MAMYMQLKRTSLVVFVVVWLNPFFVLANPLLQLKTLQEKYPHEKAIYESVSLDASIQLVDGKPKTTLTYTSTLFLLTDNPTHWADSREYMGGHIELKSIEAYSLIPEKNKFRKMVVNDFTKTAETGDGVYFDDQYAYRFTFPAVAQGAKLVVKTVMTTHDPSFPIVFFFGKWLPVEDAKLTVTCDDGIDLGHALFGYDTTLIDLVKTTLPNRTVYTWQASTLKAYTRDALAPAIRYFSPHVLLKVNGYRHQGATVPALGSINDFYNHNYKYIKNLPLEPSEAVTQMAAEITSGASSPYEKAKAIFYWVQQHIKYIAIEDGDNGYVPRQSDVVLQRRYGDCKDKSSLIVDMLKSQGLDASYVWVGTRQRYYRYSHFATPLVDDHMIACWWKTPTEPVLLDGTTLFHRFDDVPASIHGKECLIEKGPDSYLIYPIPIAPSWHNTAVDSLFVTIQNGTLHGHAKALFTGEEAANVKRFFSGRDTQKYPDMVKRALPKASNKLMVDKVDIFNVGNNDLPFEVSYTFTLPNYATTTGNHLYVNLNIDRFFQNLTIKPDRWHPVEIEYCMQRQFVCVLELPHGYVMSQLPENANYHHDDFSFSQQYQSEKNRVILTTNVIFNTLMVEHEQLSALKQMLDKLHQSYLRTIVLTKI